MSSSYLKFQKNIYLFWMQHNSRSEHLVTIYLAMVADKICRF